ncbi:HD-GYP domain-containing protein [Deinococcus sp. AJ005]|uniref:HD-GYP domain-containing protein n=1 Tax=Deinococcus sp. AJ005 TaxID=2652443 RepID=UPI0018657DB9|nr:HD-GYP domain-containing protein [Deinococcus sp. AJ005]
MLVSSLTGRPAAPETSGACEAALWALGQALEVHDSEVKGHTDRVTELARWMAEALAWSPSQRQALRWGAYLHDVGKIEIPDTVLYKPYKPGPLDASEWAAMRSHVEGGVQFAAELGFVPETTLQVIADHHERWDGQGYPAGKAGCQISLAGRVLALCDVYDALISDRPYKKAWTPQEALVEIGAQAGRQFDPVLTEVFVALLRQRRADADWAGLS